jgi:hypothetical protein
MDCTEAEDRTSLSDDYPFSNVVLGTPAVSFWEHVREVFQDKYLESEDPTERKAGHITVLDFQNRFCVTSFNVVFAYSQWAQISKTPIKDFQAPASSYDLFSPVYYGKKSGSNFTDHTAFFNVFSTVGRDIVESYMGAHIQGTAGLPTNGQSVIAAFIVYISQIVAYAAAKLRGRDTDDNGAHTAVYVYDLYASLIWVCKTLKDFSLFSNKTDMKSLQEALTYLVLMFSQDRFYAHDERYQNYWSELTFMEDPGKPIGEGIKEFQTYTATLPGLLDGTTSIFNPKGPQKETVRFIEAAAFQIMSFSVRDWPTGCYAVMTRLPFFPLQVTDNATKNIAEAVWNVDEKDALINYALIADADLALFIGGDAPIKPKDCKDPNYWSKTQNKCLRIPKCPDSTETFDKDTEECVDTAEVDCKKRKADGENVYWSKKNKACLDIPTCKPGEHFDEDFEACFANTPTPSGGGGGGGGGGSGGSPLLLIGIVGALALFAGR